MDRECWWEFDALRIGVTGVSKYVSDDSLLQMLNFHASFFGLVVKHLSPNSGIFVGSRRRTVEDPHTMTKQLLCTFLFTMAV